MKKIRNFMNSPMTWKSYCKMGAITTVIGLVITGVSAVMMDRHFKKLEKEYVEIEV